MSTERPRRPRRRVLAVGLVATTACLLLGLTLFGRDLALPGSDDPSPAADPQPWASADYVNTGVPGDTDADGKVSKTEQEALDVTAASVEKITSTVGASRGGDTVLLTPSGDNWWGFVTSQAPSAGLAGSPAPEQATWYASTEGRAFNSASDVNAYYQAIHVSFDAESDAVDWVESLAADGYGGATMYAIRGRVVTMTPTWVDPRTEPYPDVDDKALDSIEAKVALWRIDFTEQALNRAREASDPIAYADFWAATGITGTWTATSPRPDVPWVGTLDGFDADAADAQEVASIVNLSTYECTSGRECRSDMGISEAIGDMYVADSTGARAGEETLAPTEITSGKDEGLAFALVLDDQFRGMVNESYSLNGVTKTEYLVSTAGTLTLRFTFTAPETGTT